MFSDERPSRPPHPAPRRRFDQTTEPDNPLGQYDGWKRGWEMMLDLETPGSYDLIMRTRADMEYEVPLDFGAMYAQFSAARVSGAWGGNFLLLPCRSVGWDLGE